MCPLDFCFYRFRMYQQVFEIHGESKVAGQISPLTPSYDLNWGHKISLFLFLPHIFISGFTTLQFLRGSGKPYVESLNSWSQ